jgi:predicted NUDIX family NTP pyrophosphohydrolase
MAKTSAGLLVYRKKQKHLEVFLVHPGGPFWKKKDKNAWSIPKGEFEAPEQPLDAAIREFEEETGFSVKGEFLPLTPVKQPGGKIVYAWAIQSDFDPGKFNSNTFTITWPPGSGKKQQFPEIDKADWFVIPAAIEKILKGQIPLLEELQKLVSS